MNRSKRDGDSANTEHAVKSSTCFKATLLNLSCAHLRPPLNRLNCPAGPSVWGWERHQAGELNWSVEGFTENGGKRECVTE